MLFADTYRDAWRKGYRELEPANQYNVDYSMIGTARVEPVLRRIRNGMAGAGMIVESAKGECNLGQHEIAFRYTDALTTCDNHAIYKTGAKEIADQAGMALTFMAKFDEREGNSCHVHISLREADGGGVFAGDGRHGFSPLFEQFIAGQLACLRELCYLFAPNINSYKRYAASSFAPTAVAWGMDNRTCALRVVGHGPSLRVENRVPGGDMNPYLGVAALIAAGLHGIERELPLEPELIGNAYTADRPSRVPPTLREAAELFAASTVATEGVRVRSGRALRERGPGGAGRVRRDGHRLGAQAWLRTALSPIPRSAHRVDRVRRAGRVRGVGRGHRAPAAQLHRHGRRGRWDPGAAAPAG